LEELGLDGRLLLKLILNKQGVKAWTEHIGSRIGTTEGLL
jgi:hypothetical protein